MDWSVLEREPGSALERALQDDPRDHEAWVVFADYISSHAPRLGKRIMLELQRNNATPEQRRTWTERIRGFDRRHRHEWLDPGLASVFDRHGKAPASLALDWRFGFVVGARLDGGMHHDRPGLDEALAALLASPLSRFLSRLNVEFGTRPLAEREGVCALIRASSPRPALREINYDDLHGLTQVDELLAWAPRLETLRARGRLRIDVLEHSLLRELSLTIDEELPASVRGRALLPRLESVRLIAHVGGNEEHRLAVARSLIAKFAGAELPALTTLHIETPEIFDWLIVDLVPLGLLEQARVLEVLNSGFGPIAASGLCNLKRRGELDRLERVVVSRHDMHPASLRMMQELFELVVER